MASDAEWEDSPAYRKLKALVEEGDEWAVVFRTPHSGMIEFGTGPSHEPEARGQYIPALAPILAWVERKLGLSGDHARSVAFAIRNKIAETGMNPQPFARPAVAQVRYEIPALIEDELSLKPVMERIAELAREFIEANGSVDSGAMAREIYVVHGPVEL